MSTASPRQVLKKHMVPLQAATVVVVLAFIQVLAVPSYFTDSPIYQGYLTAILTVAVAMPLMWVLGRAIERL